MGAWLGVVAPTGDGSEQNSRSGAGKETAKAVEKRAMLDAAGVTGGGTTCGTTCGTTEGGATVAGGGTTACSTDYGRTTEGGGGGATEATEATRDATRATGVSATGAGDQAAAAPAPAATPAATDDEDDIFNFGLEDVDGAEWVDYVPPPRIKESRLTPEERAKFKSHLDLIFSSETILGQRIDFDPDDVIQVMRAVIPYLESEPSLIEDVPFDITIVGDLYGQLYDLNRVFHGFSQDGKPGWECAKFIFLGNYVDRGAQSLEIVMALFCIKMLYPDDIFLLRGNHEFVATNSKQGFAEELDDRYYPEVFEFLFFKINEVFCWLSIAAILGDTYLCVHAGISPGIFTRRAMKGIYKPIAESTEDVIVHDIVWSDPAKGLRGTTFNHNRGTSFYYGFTTLALAMRSMKVKAVFKGHNAHAAGYGNFYDVCYTIFTATDHRFSGNKGSIAVIDDKGKLTLNILEINPNRTKLEKALAALDAPRKSEIDKDVKGPVTKIKMPRPDANKKTKNAKRAK